MMVTVREKLCGHRWPPRAPVDLNASSIAVLSTRFLLDLSPTASQAQQFEEDQVRSNLRMLYSVHLDRHTMVTGSSPEPLVAEAAAQMMHFRVPNLRNQVYIDVWKLLGGFVEAGFAPQGTVGELIGRALSILAMDDAIDQLKNHCELRYQTPVSVPAYYRALLTDEAWEKLRQSTPANRAWLTTQSATKTFEDAFADAYFHFSHYGKANDATPIQDRYAWALWLRGTAVLCQLNQELSDRAIPIFFSNLKTLSPQSVSMAFDQDKTGKTAQSDTVAIQSAEVLGLFSQGNKLPYIDAVHCYALTKDEGIAVQPSPSHIPRGKAVDEQAPRYRIDFRGLAAYRQVTIPLKAHIQRMIDGSKNALFRHHPRQYGLPSLRKMLPVLDDNPDATAWFGSLGDTPVDMQGGGGGFFAGKGKGKEKEKGPFEGPSDVMEPPLDTLEGGGEGFLAGKGKGKEMGPFEGPSDAMELSSERESTRSRSHLDEDPRQTKKRRKKAPKTK
jgi:hypothetical protein